MDTHIFDSDTDSEIIVDTHCFDADPDTDRAPEKIVDTQNFHGRLG